MTTIASITAARAAFTQYVSQVAASRQYITTQRGLMAQSPCDALVALAVIQHFGSAVAIFNTISATPGIVNYARTEASDQAYDVVAEFTAILNAMTSARDTLIGMFPKDGSGFLLYQTLNANGTVSTRTFTAAQLAPAVALLDSVIAVLS